jgi:hypothetical protein
VHCQLLLEKPARSAMPMLKKPAAVAVAKVCKKPAATALDPEVGRGKQSGTGIVTLTSKDGQLLLEKHKLNTLSLDQKLELLRLTLQGYC